MDAANKVARTIQIDGSRNLVRQTTNIMDLPESLIHHIVSSLSLKDLIRVSLSSKAWEHLSYATPYLTLDIDDLSKTNSSSLKGANRVRAFADYMDRLLVFRRGLQLERFTLTMRSNLVTEYRMKTWIIDAIKSKVKELDLVIRPATLILPFEIFTLPSLRLFKLDMNRQYLKLPCRFELPNLESMSLIQVKLPNDPLVSWLSTQCPNLRTLILENCFGFTTLNVTSSSLEKFSIWDPPSGELVNLNISCQNLKSLYLNLASPYNVDSSFKLFSPNLESFTWFGRVTKCCNVEPFKYLYTASLTYSGTNLWNDLYDFVKVLVHQINNARVLRLCSISMQIIGWATKTTATFSLPNLEHLVLSTYMNDSETCLSMALLKRCPNIKTLIISQEMNSKVLTVVKQEDYIGIRVSEFVHHLKKVEMRLMGSGENNWELLKFLLKNEKGSSLRINIIYSLSEHQLVKKFADNLKDFEKNSSCPILVVCLLPDNFEL